MVKYVGKARPKTKAKPVKKLYIGEYVFDCQYVKGWLFKRLVSKTVREWSRRIVLAETPDMALGKFIEIYEDEYDDADWNNNKLPWWITWVNHIPQNTVVLNRNVEIHEAMRNIESLKEKMNADEFLAYCRQEMLEPIEVIK
jgi:hypothetical protein